jgi:hypothetical protein
MIPNFNFKIKKEKPGKDLNGIYGQMNGNKMRRLKKKANWLKIYRCER